MLHYLGSGTVKESYAFKESCTTFSFNKNYSKHLGESVV